jgi:hypothetical protein
LWGPIAPRKDSPRGAKGDAHRPGRKRARTRIRMAPKYSVTTKRGRLKAGPPLHWRSKRTFRRDVAYDCYTEPATAQTTIAQHGVTLRQSYTRVGKRALMADQRHAHAKPFKRANRALHASPARIVVMAGFLTGNRWLEHHQPAMTASPSQQFCRTFSTLLSTLRSGALGPARVRAPAIG